MVPSQGTIEPSPLGLGIIGTVEEGEPLGTAGAVRWAGAVGFAVDDDVAGPVLVGACSVVWLPHAAALHTASAARVVMILCLRLM
ncbi:hypothetical protein [Mycobacterium sp. 141]|uniref:hypothetical protein n=1 Tax=Mycobacterium sp. 141 TaxID=1120797 RepID=UPI0018C92628|nr:hypothetical protein [Mycobacterium sp. 141]